MTKTVFYYTDGACGTGKTWTALNKIVSYGGRHIFVVDRQEIMAERASLTQKLAIEHESEISIRMIHSGIKSKHGNRAIRHQVAELADLHPDGDDAIIFISHEAMKLTDFSGFAGWNIWIDEIPSILDSATPRIRLSWDTFEKYYSLDPITQDDKHNGWAKASLKPDAPSLSELVEDDGVADAIVALYRRITGSGAAVRRDVLVNAGAWSDFKAPDKRCSWYSLWSPETLVNFETVNFLANAFQDSMTFQIIRARWPEIDWQEVKSNIVRPFANRAVNIHYYAENHVATRGLFQSDQGKENLALVAKHINSEIGSGDHIWTCNGDEEDIFKDVLKGRKLSPRQAGTNNFSHIHNATMIYSVKPDPEQRKVLHLLGVDAEYYSITNEKETIVQFMCRTSIRDPQSTETVNLFVYDKSQAEFLERYFLNDPRSYARPALILHDLGFANVERKAGRPILAKTDEEIAAAKDRVRELNKAAKARARAKAKAEKLVAL